MKLCNSYLQRVGGAVLVGQRLLGNIIILSLIEEG